MAKTIDLANGGKVTIDELEMSEILALTEFAAANFEELEKNPVALLLQNFGELEQKLTTSIKYEGCSFQTLKYSEVKKVFEAFKKANPSFFGDIQARIGLILPSNVA